MQLQDYCFFSGFLLWGRWGGGGGGGVGEGYELITRKTSNDVSIAVSPDREEKCDITKIQICEIMGLDRILRKNKMKKAAFPKISLLVHWNWRGDNYKHLLCSEDSTQIVLNLAGVETWRSRLIFEGFIIMESLEHTKLLSPQKFALTGWFLASEHFSSCSFWICQHIP